MSFAFGTTNRINTENSTHLAGKNVLQSSNVPSKRPALGEIGNTLDRFAVPAARNGIKKSQILKGSIQVREPTKPSKFVKSEGPERQLKSTASSSSLFSVSNLKLETAPIASFTTGNIQDIEDVDKDDMGNPLLVASYAPDIYRYLLELELQFPVRPNFLADQDITPKMRATLVDWLVDVQDQYKLLQETLFLTISIIDRYLQGVPTERKYLQLVGVAALFIAGKYEEVYFIDVGELAFVTDNAYSSKDVLKMEKKILKELNFDLGKPLSLHFLRRFSKVSKVLPIHHNFSKYFLEWSLVDYDLCHIRPSRLAAAALYISMCITGHTDMTSRQLWNKTLEHFSGVPVADVQTVAVKMAGMVLKTRQSKYKAIERKYASAKMMKVSQRPEISTDTLKKMAKGDFP